MKYGVLFLAAALVSCSSVPQTSKTAETKSDIWDMAGENSMATPSPDGRWVVFVRADTSQHKYPQLYMKNLLSGEEKRLTYQIGQVNFPTFSRDGRYIYFFSDTDETKDNPPELIKVLDPKSRELQSFHHPHFEMPTGDVYRLNMFSNVVERMTKNPGFQGMAAATVKSEGFWFVSHDNHAYDLHYFDLKTRSGKRARHNENMNLEPAVSPKGDQIVWTEFSSDGVTSRIQIADPLFKSVKAPVVYSGIMASPAWRPQGDWIVFSAQFQKRKNFDLYAVRVVDGCLNQLTQTQLDESWPRYMADGESVVYTVSDGKKSHLQQVSFQPQATCLDPAQIVP